GPARQSVERLHESLARARQAAAPAFAELAAFLAGRGKVRIDLERDPSRVFPPSVDPLLEALADTLKSTGQIRAEALPAEDDADAEKHWPHVLRALEHWERPARALLEVTGAIAPGRCATMEVQRSSGVVLESVPWDVAREAREELTSRLQAAVLTSATLST